MQNLNVKKSMNIERQNIQSIMLISIIFIHVHKNLILH